MGHFYAAVVFCLKKQQLQRGLLSRHFDDLLMILSPVKAISAKLVQF